uniref:Uncharacterized protein n=1 Tax=Oryza barthii TaxID=65489 RepID=A0A0D3ESB3_9ORYZ
MSAARGCFIPNRMAAVDDITVGAAASPCFPLQLPPSGTGHRRAAGRPPLSRLALLASGPLPPPLCLAQKERKRRKREGDDVDYPAMWGLSGSHADSAAT